MPCGYANPTEIGARERFMLVVFIFRVRPLQVCSVLLRWAIPGPRLVERANSKVLTLFLYIGKTGEPYATAIPNIWEHIYLNQSF